MAILPQSAEYCGLEVPHARNKNISFQTRIDEFRQMHSRKPSLIERLRKRLVMATN